MANMAYDTNLKGQPMKKLSLGLLLLIFVLFISKSNYSNILYDFDNTDEAEKLCHTIKDTTSHINEPVPCPACEYCRYLGYEVDHESGIVTFPDSSTADHREFFKGAVAKHWSFCEQSGYRLETVSEDMGQWLGEYAVCVFDDSTVCLESHFYKGLCQPGECEDFSFTSGCCNGDE